MRDQMRRTLEFFVSFVIIAAVLIGVTPAAIASSVTPQEVSGNPTCADYGATLYVEFNRRVRPVGGDARGITVTETGWNGRAPNRFDWSSASQSIDLVILKGGDAANLYRYSGATSDTDIVTPANGSDEGAGLSHIQFCVSAAAPPPPGPSPSPSASPSADPTPTTTPTPTTDPTPTTTPTPTTDPTPTTTPTPTTDPTPTTTPTPTTDPTPTTTPTPTTDPTPTTTPTPTTDPTPTTTPSTTPTPSVEPAAVPSPSPSGPPPDPDPTPQPQPTSIPVGQTGITTATIVIEKQTIPSGVPQRFTFTGDVSGSLRDGDTASREVSPGTYTANESPSTGWRLTAIDCTTGGTGNVTSATATFVVNAGETVRCTFTNRIRTQVLSATATRPTTSAQTFGDVSADVLAVTGGGLPGALSGGLLLFILGVMLRITPGRSRWLSLIGAARRPFPASVHRAPRHGHPGLRAPPIRPPPRTHT